MSHLGDNPSMQEIINQVSAQISESQVRQKEISRYIQNIHSMQQDLFQKIQALTKLQQDAIEAQKSLSENLDRLIALEKKLSKKNNLPSSTPVYQSYDSGEADSQKSPSLFSIFKRKPAQSVTTNDSYGRERAPEPVPPTPTPSPENNSNASYSDYTYSSECLPVPSPQPPPDCTHSSEPPPDPVPAYTSEPPPAPIPVPFANKTSSQYTEHEPPLTIAELFSNQVISAPRMLTDEMCMNVFRNFILQYDFVTSGFSDYKNMQPEIINLAVTIANNYKRLHFFMKRLKASAYMTDELVFDFQKRASPTISLVVNLAKQLKDVGYFEECEYQKSTRTLRIIPSNKVAYNQFITGKWLEIYANQVANRAIKKIYEEQNILGLVLSNVKIAHKNSKCIAHEFDTVIVTPYQIYFVECKTGEYLSCLPKYERIADEFDLPLSSIFVVLLGMEMEECQKMSDLYQMKFCNQTTFYITLITELRATTATHLEENSTTDI